MDYPHGHVRGVIIAAPQELVFRYFTDNERWASWWGPGSSIEPRPGGRVSIRFPNAVTVIGEVLELDAPDRIRFTYGYEDPSKPIPPGGSRVGLELETGPEGTRLFLSHEVTDAKARDLHVPGWRYQLAVLANAISREADAGAPAAVDRWFDAWNTNDSAERRAVFEELAAMHMTYRDAFACTRGPADLAAHVEATRIHLPDLTLARDGEVRICQGKALVHWTAKAPDGTVRASGDSVFELGTDGKLAAVTAFWAR